MGNEHIDQEPSGRSCIEPDCGETAGTVWSGYSGYRCPEHDKQRQDRLADELTELARSVREGGH